MEIRVFTIRSVESDTAREDGRGDGIEEATVKNAREDGRGDGIEEAVVKNARVPLLAAPSATVSNAGLLSQTPREKTAHEVMVVKIRVTW